MGNEAHVLRVKIGDFGTSKYVPLSDATTYLKTSTGTRGYMAPEMDDTEIPKTNRVDIWSLGCILYRMFAGSPLFPTTRRLYGYALAGSSPPPEVKNAGFSVSCVNFLSDVLQPEPEDRPSAEDCIKKAWITNKASSPEHPIGRDLYSRLTEIERAAPRPEPPVFWEPRLETPVYGEPRPEPSVYGEPRLETLADAAVNPAVGVHGSRELPAWKFNYEIGHGTFGTVFLEKVQTRGMDFPELWAVKRIPKAVANFPARRYLEEIRNLQALSNVSFVQTSLASQRELVSFDLWEVPSNISTV